MVESLAKSTWSTFEANELVFVSLNARDDPVNKIRY